MTSHLVPNCLLSERKRLGLSQADVAYLAGVSSNEEVCRQERFARKPSLDDAFAYEAIYKRSASELLGGHYRNIEQEVVARAKSLSKRISRKKPHRGNLRKCRALQAIAGLETANNK